MFYVYNVYIQHYDNSKIMIYQNKRIFYTVNYAVQVYVNNLYLNCTIGMLEQTKCINKLNFNKVCD